MTFIGIDPGKTGSISLYEDGELTICKMPSSVAEMSDVFQSIVASRNVNSIYAVLEKVHSMKGQGVSSTFTFGQGFGWLQAMLAAYHIKTIEVTPQRWMKLIGVLPKEKHDRKLAIQDWVQKRIGKSCGLGVADGAALALLAESIWNGKC